MVRVTHAVHGSYLGLTDPPGRIYYYLQYGKCKFEAILDLYNFSNADLPAHEVHGSGPERLQHGRVYLD